MVESQIKSHAKVDGGCELKDAQKHAYNWAAEQAHLGRQLVDDHQNLPVSCSNLQSAVKVVAWKVNQPVILK